MFLEYELPKNIGYVVQIAPPNQGSELVDYQYNVDRLRELWGSAPFDAGSGKYDIPKQLGAVEGYRLGVIAGSLSTTTYTDQLIDGRDDGVISVDHTRVKGMREHIVVKEQHHMMMKNEQVMNKAVDFIRWGTFRSYY